MKLPKGLGNMNMMAQMQEALSRAQNIESELKDEILESETGPIKVVFNGLGELQQIKLDPSIVDPNDIEMLEDMIVGAVRTGFEKATEMRSAKTNAILPNIPGLPKF